MPRARSCLRRRNANPSSNAAPAQRVAAGAKAARESGPIRGVQLPLPDSEPDVAPKAKAEIFGKPKKEKPRLPRPKRRSAPSVPIEIKSKAKIIKDVPTSDEDAKKKYVPRPDTLPPMDLLKRVKEVKEHRC